MRVLMADDDPQVRSALHLILEQEVKVSLFDEVDNAAALLKAVEQQPPDLLLLDWNLPGLHPSAQILAHLHHSNPRLKVIVLGGRPEDNVLAIALGADAFVSKTDPPENLLNALWDCMKAA